MTERAIYFLKELPDKYLLMVVLVILLLIAIRFGAVDPREIWQLVRDVTIAIVSIAGYRRYSQPTQEINADIKTDSLSLNPVPADTSTPIETFDKEKA